MSYKVTTRAPHRSVFFILAFPQYWRIISTQPMENQEEFRVSGDDLVRKVKEIIRQGNVRRIIIKNEQGEEIIQMPLTARFHSFKACTL